MIGQKHFYLMLNLIKFHTSLRVCLQRITLTSEFAKHLYGSSCNVYSVLFKFSAISNQHASSFENVL